ncbi:MAG: tRNA (adenosine(37)-N6)-dimethylallyltransferase MiaA [Pseudomonadaceae bacterium]|nr:tRNA (adenosine(37)-N6)-dimethylallyltransferase MiaA [Pseudomonadaceae bacterium]
MNRQVVLLLGPTAVGKTAAAMALFDQLGGADKVRLISADSALVYQGMDIGTAKPSAAELKRYPHELIDFRAPQDTYTAADFVTDADLLVEDALQQGQVPVIVGGTMLYVKRFVEGIARLPSADPTVRAQLQAAFDAGKGPELHAELVAIDPSAAANIHPNNPQRLLRALEIVRQTGQPVSHLWSELGGLPAVERLQVQLRSFAIVPDDRQVLHERIAVRFAAMLEAGFLGELQSLYARPELRADLPALRAVGYRQGFAYLRGECSEAQFHADALTATRRLAKRQLTWLRQWPDLQNLFWGDSDTLAAKIISAVKPL